MNSPRSLALLLLPVCLFSACDSGGGGTSEPAPAARLLVTTNTAVIAPASTPAPSVDMARLGAARVEANYRVTTPAGEPFAFDVVSWCEGAKGAATVSVAHVRDGGVDVSSGEASFAAAGILPQGKGVVADNGWLAANGDGFVRLSLQGCITRDQVIAVAADGDGVALVELLIGGRSAINRPDGGALGQPGVVSEQTIYSSDADQFGLPTVAVSGDRTSIVCYEGDRQNASGQRYEMRLQHDAATGAVTGGGSTEASLDNGFWRDHEISALHNVLALARSEASGVRVRLSFDRGASFAQEVELPIGITQSRLVQAAMAADYTLAVACWRTALDNAGVELVLVEGAPVGYDAVGSPTWFQFGPAQVVYHMPLGSSPLTTGIAWSSGGDLVIGYGASWFQPMVGWAWRSTTEFRCAVRRHGGELRDRLVDRQEILGMDPTVAVLGEGQGLQIFYAYEVRDGVRLATSPDAGETFQPGVVWGEQGDHLPTVFARIDGLQTRVDVLFLASRAEGTELHRATWRDWPNSPREDAALTTARLEWVQPSAPPVGGFAAPFVQSMRSTQIGWLGYDAVQDGDEIVVAYDEATCENAYWGSPWVGATTTGISIPGIFANPFQPATPPPLAPGMTEPVPAVDPAHAHQLVLLRLQ